MPDYQFILAETHRNVGLVRFNRPKELNALNSTLMEEMVTALEAFDRDPAIGCLVVTGASGLLRPAPTSARWPRPRRWTCSSAATSLAGTGCASSRSR